VDVCKREPMEMGLKWHRGVTVELQRSDRGVTVELQRSYRGVTEELHPVKAVEKRLRGVKEVTEG